MIDIFDKKEIEASEERAGANLLKKDLKEQRHKRIPQHNGRNRQQELPSRQTEPYYDKQHIAQQ